MRGGNWSNSSDAGAFALNLNNVRTNSNDNVSGRDSGSMPETSQDETGHTGMRYPAVSKIYRRDLLSSTIENQKPSKPKRIGHLYERLCDIDTLHEAYLNSRHGKRKKNATYRFDIDAGVALYELHDELCRGVYAPRPYTEFIVYEPKKRVINAPHFRDLVVQHAVYALIYEIFDRRFIDSSYACRRGKGTHAASVFTQRAMRRYDGELYFAKLDIRKFFYSIDRDILRTLFHKRIKDVRFVDLMMSFAHMDTPKGIPIGNLLSQIYANIYMNEMDQYAKRTLKIKDYVRYVDDFIAIGLTLEDAKAFKSSCELFAQEALALELSHWQISKIKRGINFVGYRTWKLKKFVRKHSMYLFKKSVKKGRLESIASLFGHAKHTQSLSYFRRVLIEFCSLQPKQGALNV